MTLLRPVLGLESSCDETAAAVLDGAGRVLAEAVLSQVREHARFGGVVPEIAARAHLTALPDLVRRVMDQAGLRFADLGGVAASAGPGLIGGLIVGSQLAKGIAIAQALPYVAVNHLEAHALTARLPGLVLSGEAAGGETASGGKASGGKASGETASGGKASGETAGGAPFPYLLLLISGGHCQCVAVQGVGRFTRLGGTVDDAAGEAFDKVGKLLGLPWPGGPALEALAASGHSARFAFPRPMLGRPGCDFSFSGLKTAVAQEVARQPAGPLPAGVQPAGAQPAGALPAGALPAGALPAGALPAGALPAQVAADIAAGFQRAVAEVLADRASHAMAMMRQLHPAARLLVVAGGVAANAAVRAALAEAAAAQRYTLVAPPVRLCTDNAVMVAWAGIERLRLGLADALDVAPRPRWPLAELAARTAALVGPD